MKAIVRERYGGPEVLELREVPELGPSDGQLLIKVHAASVNASDVHFMRGMPLMLRFMAGGLLRPRKTSMGADVAGVVEAVGPGVTRFKAGDAVFGELSGSGFGAFAEYALAKEEALCLMPTGASFAEAAALPTAAMTALQALRDRGAVGSGRTVAIEGASGGVGTAAVQIAKALGAEVTAVASAQKLETARRLGADRVIDYRSEDFTANGHSYDAVYAVNGHHTLPDYGRVLRTGGSFVMTGGEGPLMMQTMLRGKGLAKRWGRGVSFLYSKPNAADLGAVAELLGSRRVVPCIERSFPLEEATEAIRHVEAGHASGKVVITVVPERTA